MIYHGEGPLQLEGEIVDLIELPDEGLNEGLVEDDVTEVLRGRLLQHLRLKQQVTLLTNLILKILAHKVSEECTDLELHIPGHGSHHLIIQVQMLLYLPVHALLLTLHLLC